MTYLTSYQEPSNSFASQQSEQIRSTEPGNQGKNLFSSSTNKVGSTSPSSIYARITREQAAHAQANYLPLQAMANEQLLNPGTRSRNRQQMLDTATTETGNSYDRSANRFETLNSRFNQSVTQRQQSSSDRLNALDRTASTIGARNNARRVADETEMEILDG